MTPRKCYVPTVGCTRYRPRHEFVAPRVVFRGFMASRVIRSVIPYDHLLCVTLDSEFGMGLKSSLNMSVPSMSLNFDGGLGLPYNVCMRATSPVDTECFSFRLEDPRCAGAGATCTGDLGFKDGEILGSLLCLR